MSRYDAEEAHSSVDLIAHFFWRDACSFESENRTFDFLSPLSPFPSSLQMGRGGPKKVCSKKTHNGEPSFLVKGSVSWKKKSYCQLLKLIIFQLSREATWNCFHDTLPPDNPLVSSTLMSSFARNSLVDEMFTMPGLRVWVRNWKKYTGGSPWLKLSK